MEYTANYQLTQWEESDRILREDFNRDNARTEAAFLEKLGPLETIRTYTSATGGERSLNVDLSDVDWSAWKVVIVEFQGVFQNVPSGVACLLNTTGETRVACSASPPAPLVLVLFPWQDAARPARALAFPGGALTVTGDPYEGITGLSCGIGAPATLGAGCKLTVLGIR